MKKYFSLVVMLSIAACVAAQNAAADTVEADTLYFNGCISNLQTGQPQPFSQLRFVQDNREVAQVRCNAEGRFEGLSLVAGDYFLFVKVHGLTVYTADLRLSESGYLNLQVDTVRLVALKAITIEGMRHMLGSLLISSAHDRRLWGFNAGYRDANASVQLPPDAHGNTDAPVLGVDGGMPIYGPIMDPNLPARLQRFYFGGGFYTFRSGPIWTLVRDREKGAQVDTVASSH